MRQRGTIVLAVEDGNVKIMMRAPRPSTVDESQCSSEPARQRNFVQTNLMVLNFLQVVWCYSELSPPSSWLCIQRI